MRGEPHPDAMVALAIIVSRVEALVFANMLEAAGIHVCVGAANHASVSVNSIALGCHRIWVSAEQWEEASKIVLDSGISDSWAFSHGLQRSVLRFLGLWLGLKGVLTLVGIVAGAMPGYLLLGVPLDALTIPVNPQCVGDYYVFLTED